MAYENRTFYPKNPHHGENVISEMIRGVVSVYRQRLAGCAKTPACDAVDVILAGKAWGKTVECVRSISIARQEDDGLAITAPINDLELDTLLDSDQCVLCGEESA